MTRTMTNSLRSLGTNEVLSCVSQTVPSFTRGPHTYFRQLPPRQLLSAHISLTDARMLTRAHVRLYTRVSTQQTPARPSVSTHNVLGDFSALRSITRHRRQSWRAAFTFSVTFLLSPPHLPSRLKSQTHSGVFQQQR